MKSPTVLIIDDNFFSMVALRDHLVLDHGYGVELTADAQLPARLAETSYDLICLDLMIHHESLVVTDDDEQQVVDNIKFDGVNWKETGLEFLGRLRRGEFSQPGQGTPPDVPVLVLSAVADQSTVERVEAFAENSPTWFIEKPFLTRIVVQQIEGALAAG